jgi:hypothetical protein
MVGVLVHAKMRCGRAGSRKKEQNGREAAAAFLGVSVKSGVAEGRNEPMFLHSSKEKERQDAGRQGRARLPFFL